MRRIKESYWFGRVNPKCEHCRRYHWKKWKHIGGFIDRKCPLPRKSEELEKLCNELEEQLKEKEGKERENIESQLDECFRKKAKVDDTIQHCLNRRTYMAIKKGAKCFNNQYSWGISDCNSCEWYVPSFNSCVLGIEIIVTEGLCRGYKFGKPMDPEDIYPTEEEMTE